MKIAAIDIGSSAARFQVSRLLEREEKVVFKTIEYFRFPLQLGRDVFQNKIISSVSEVKFIRFLEICQQFMVLHGVNHYRACATSAMREAENSKQVIERIYLLLGIEIEIISGKKEAELLDKAVAKLLTDDCFLHVDVGGGSTELTWYFEKKKMASHSFNLGSIRVLENQDNQEEWNKMKKWVEFYVKPLFKTVAIGTGGSIRKIHQISEKKDSEALTFNEIQKTYEKIKALTLHERIHTFMLKEDRAEVIVPAANIYLKIMEWGGIEKILAPSVGLKDGIIESVYQKVKLK